MVQKLVAAYVAVTSGAMVLQGGSVFEDTAEGIPEVGASSFFLGFTSGCLINLIKVRMR
jgi:hypothetical protein